MNLKSMTQPEIGAVLKELGQPAFRGKQVYTWLHKGVGSYDEMTNLSKGLREQLAENGRHLPGSLSFVPPVMGMILAGEVLKHLAGRCEK